jgi:hypothetical protein
MSNQPEEMVERKKHSRHPATSLADAANAENSLEGYAAINNLDEHDNIARLAHQFYEERTRRGTGGSADDDWFRAEAQVRRRTGA